MTKAKLHVASNLYLPHETQTSTLLVLGGKGMGKTNLGRVIDEELSRAGLRWATLDPLGVWWGLRYSKDGKGPGIECLILGGVHGDMPIEPTGGAVVADLVVDESISVIIDFSRKPSGEMWGIGEKTRFLTDYARRLYQRQGELINGHRRDPIFQMLDEAARYVPQIIPHGNPDLAKCLSAWETLVEEGRNIGIGVGLLTQRSARINKSVSELADALFAFRTVGPNSVEAVTDWLGAHVPKDKIKAHIETLRSLERGRCLVVSPGWLQFEGIADIREGTTFDSSATPKPGERAHRVHGAGAKPDLAKYQERMRETIERARENDPKALRQQIQQMKAELARAPKIAEVKSVAAADPELRKQNRAAQLAIAHLQEVMEESMRILTKITLKGFEADPINAEEMEAALKKAAQEIGKLAAAKIKAKELEFDELKKQCDRLLRRAKAIMDSVASGNVIVGVSVTKNEPVTVRQLPPQAPHAAAAPSRAVSPEQMAAAADGLKPSHLRVLNCLAELLDVCGVESVPKEQLAGWGGYSPQGGGYGNILGTLRTAGMLDYGGAGIVITAAGRGLAKPTVSAITNKEMLARAKTVLKPAEAKIFETIHAAWPQAISKEDVAAQTGYTASGGGFGNYLGHMRTLGFITYESQGPRAADWLFVEHKNGAAA